MQKSSARPRTTQDVEPLWKKALDQNVRFLQENLLLTESIFAYLVQEKILTMEMIDMIKTSSDSEHGRTIELVKCLKKRSENCFEKFLYVLHDTGNEFVAEKLEQSIPPPSRQSHSSDEMDLQLQMKDQQILELEAKLLAKERRIKELESVADKLKSRVEETLVVLKQEMQISDHYKQSRAVFYDEELRNVNEMQLEINEKDEQLKEAEEKVEELQSRVEELQEELEYVREDLKTREDELNIVLDNERRTKRKLGLDEDATEGELMEHLQKSFNTRSELKRVQDELGNITRTKMALSDLIKSLAHQNDSLQFELRQKELEIQRIRRGNLDSALPKRKRDAPPAVTRRQIGLLERTKTVPKIDVSSYPQLPDPVALRPSIPTRSRSNLLTARLTSAVAQDNQLPKLLRRKTFLSIEDRETKYCVICRRNYYLKSECRIHVGPIVSGRFSCCGADANLKYVGCKMVNHLYIYFTGLGNEYVFYDERGRPLDFKDQ